MRVEESAEPAVIPKEVGRSKANTGRKGASAPPEMQGLKRRLHVALAELNAARVKSGLARVTQKELGEAAGLSQSVMSDFFGKESLKTALKEGFEAATLARLCLALGTDVNFILLGDGETVPKLARRSASSLIPAVDVLREETAPLPPAAPLAPLAHPVEVELSRQPTPLHKATKRAARRPPSP